MPNVNETQVKKAFYDSFTPISSPKKATCMSVIQSSLLVAAIVFAFFLKNIKVDSFFLVCIYVNYFEMQTRCLDAV